MKSREIEKKAMLVVKERFLNLLTASCAPANGSMRSEILVNSEYTLNPASKPLLQRDQHPIAPLSHAPAPPTRRTRFTGREHGPTVLVKRASCYSKVCLRRQLPLTTFNDSLYANCHGHTSPGAQQSALTSLTPFVLDGGRSRAAWAIFKSGCPRPKASGISSLGFITADRLVSV
jgi:hypothetical protein